MTRARFGIVSLALLAACSNDLAPPEIVKTSRVLAIVAEPPEAMAGQDVSFDAMISIPAEFERPISLRWRVCLDLESMLDESGLEIDLPGPDVPCDDPVELAEGEPFVVSGERTAALVEQLTSLSSLGGFDPALIQGLLAVGLVFEPDVDVVDANGEVLVSAFKRAALVGRPASHNPPPPVFTVADRAVELVDRFTCAATDGDPIALPRDAEVAIEPTLPDGETEEDWLEEFPILDYTGGVLIGKENAYYSYYVTAGGIGGTTRPPDRGTTWRTPDEPGPHSLWVVLRDGHLGTSACRLDVEIE